VLYWVLTVAEGILAENTEFNHYGTMVRLSDIQKQADELSPEDRSGLIAHLLHTLEHAPEGPTDKEVIERDAEMESGKVQPISQEQFIQETRPDLK